MYVRRDASVNLLFRRETQFTVSLIRDWTLKRFRFFLQHASILALK